MGVDKMPFMKPFQEVVETSSKLSKKDFTECYSITRTFAHQGSKFGVTLLGLDKETNKPILVKSVFKDKYGTQIRILADELKLLEKLKHDHVPELINWFNDGEVCHLVFDIQDHVEMEDEIRKRNLPEKFIKVILKTLVETLSDLHKKGIVHRNVRLDNIYFNLDAKETEVAKSVKLMDFSMSKDIKDDDISGVDLHSLTGTTLYMAPELFYKVKYSVFGRKYYAKINGPNAKQNRIYNYKCDIFSLGIVAWKMLSKGRVPFKFGEHSRDDYMKQWKKQLKNFQVKYSSFVPQIVWKDNSKQAKEFLKLLLQRDPERRPTYLQILSNKWFEEEKPSVQRVRVTRKLDSKNEIDEKGSNEASI